MFAAATMCHIHRCTTRPTQRFKPQAMLRNSDRIEILSNQIAFAESAERRAHATSHAAPAGLAMVNSEADSHDKASAKISRMAPALPISTARFKQPSPLL